MFSSDSCDRIIFAASCSKARDDACNWSIAKGEVVEVKQAEKARSLVELIVICIIILVLSGIFISHGNIILLRAREAALRNELSNLRLSVSLYRILNEEYPDSIEILVNRPYDIGSGKGPVLKGKFLKNSKYDKAGRLKDPFGNIFIYNSQTGVVKSNTEGYNNW